MRPKLSSCCHSNLWKRESLIMNSQRITGRIFAVSSFCGLLVTVALVGCAPKRSQKPEPCYVSAKALFEQASRDYHIPSAEAKGAARARLESQAAAMYRQIIQNCDDNCSWAAQAARSLGNIYASQTNVAAAVEWYAKVGERYPRQEFEVLMAWKSAADLLWDSGRADDAKAFYQKIVNRYDAANAAAII